MQIATPLEIFERPSFLGAPAYLEARGPAAFGSPALTPDRVNSVESRGRDVPYPVDLPGGTRLRAIGADLGRFEPGTSIDWGIDPTKLLVFNKDGVRP
jgi:hypothetical protein